MQLVLVQAEIEQALKDYVGRTLKVADGVGISIELTATRGAEGFKAFIDIQPISGYVSPQKAFEEVIKQQPFIASTARTPEPEYAQEPETVVQLPETQVPFEMDHDEHKTDANAANEQVPAPQGNTRSLFKGLGKPKNIAS